MFNQIRSRLGGFAACYFQQDSAGRTIYYPWGWLGRGVEMPSERFRERLSVMHSAYLLSAVAIGVASSRLGLQLTLIVVAIHVVSFAVLIQALTWRQPRSSRPFDAGQARLASVDTIGRPVLFFLGLLSLLLALLGVVILANGEIGLGLLVLAVFIPTTAMAFWLASLRSQDDAMH